MKMTETSVLKFKKDESADKLRGGYYTPEILSDFLVRWVLAKKPGKLLEPSCGDGSFLRSLVRHVDYSADVTGVEIHAVEAEKSRRSAAGNPKLKAVIENADFLDYALKKIENSDCFDAVLGNPPYIRYQYLSAVDQLLSERIFAWNGLPFTKHTNAWVPFVIASLDLLSPGGRLGMVIPSELMHVLHAASLRSHLLRHCSRVLMIDPTELLFDEALQGTVLLMLEKKISHDTERGSVAVTAVPDVSFAKLDPTELFENANYVSGNEVNGKWLTVLLEKEELKVLEKARGLPTVRKFSDVAKVDVGIVTGANKFFLVNDETVKRYDLSDYVHPMFGRSEHCPGIVYDEATHKSNVIRGLPAHFVYFGGVTDESLTEGAREYIALGEDQDLHTRYKCRIRKPWYVVPSVYKSPIGMLKRSHHFPRLILNSAGAYTTDTAYRIRSLSAEISDEGLVYSFINTLTALSAELEGRHYGGGVLELVPSEIEKLLVPLQDASASDLEDLDVRLREIKDPAEILKVQDEIVLAGAGLSISEIEILQRALIRIRSRRHRLQEAADVKEEKVDD